MLGRAEHTLHARPNGLTGERRKTPHVATLIRGWRLESGLAAHVLNSPPLSYIREVLNRLPFSCFRLQDHRFTVRGRSPRAVSGGPSTGRTRGSGGTLPVTSRASPSAVRWCLCGVEAPASFASRLLQPHVSKRRSCFYPWDRFTTGRPNRMELARRYRGSLAAVRITGKGRGPFISRLKIRGFLAHVL